MSTFGQIAGGAYGVLGDSGINGSVAVAAAALVVVLTIVVVFMMVLRSNGSAGKTAHGLGYDAQRGPLGQPQNDPETGWGRPSAPSTPADAANGWGAPSRGGAANGWGASPDLASNSGQPGQFGQMGVGAPASGAGARAGGGWGAPTPAANGWDMPAAAPAQQQDAGGWGAPQRANDGGWGAAPAPASRPAQSPASRPAWGDAPSSAPAWGDAPSSAPAWGDAAAASPAAPAAPAAGGMPAWGAPAPANDPAPWDAGAPAGAPQWGGQAASAPASSPAAAGGWGAPAPAAPSAPRQGVPSGPIAGGFGGNGFDAAAPAYGEDRTRVARPGGPQRLGVVVVRQGKEPGRIFEIRKERMTIGRSRDSDIFLEDLAVSRLHTTVGHDEAGNYVIRDENSANGTYVNNQRITEQYLEEGDEIQVGQTILAFMKK